MRKSTIPTLLMVASLLASLFNIMWVLDPSLASAELSEVVRQVQADPIIVDGVVDLAYGSPVASDPSGDGNGNAPMDLLDLYVIDDADYFYLAFTINADIVSSNWGKYVIYVDTSNDANGATSDAWTRNVVVTGTHKPEYGIYTWVDSPPYGANHTQLVHWTGSAWDWAGVQQVAAAARAYDGAKSTIEYQVAKMDLGNPDTMWVEVWDTGGGGGDNAQDTINDPPGDWDASDWSTQAILECSTEVKAGHGSIEPPMPGQDDNVWWDGLEHDSRDDFYRQPFGAVSTGTPVILRFRTFAGDVTGVRVRFWDTAWNEQTLQSMSYLTTIPGDPYDYDIWEVQFDALDHLTVLYYRFIVTDGSDVDYYEDDALFDGALGQAYDDSPDNSWQIDVHRSDLNTPDWFKDAIVYQIFPDRFRDGLDANDPISGTFFYDEDPGVLTTPEWNWIVPDPRVSGSPWEGSYSKLFYGGDLQGIIEKLDYLQSLGVTTLYLNPIFESPSNHKYDTTDYTVVDDNLGDLATFQALATELSNRGMHLVLDGVFNHTSSDSVYFDRFGRYPEMGACESVSSTYRSWYYFSPADPPGTGVCDGDTDYVSWWGFDSLPKLNTTDEDDVRDYFYRLDPAVAAYWLNQGADGWRLDVAGDVDQSFWEDWRPYIRSADPYAITIAEEWGDASHFVLGDALDSAMNYRFRNAIIGLLRETDWQDTNSLIPALSVSQFDSLMHSIEEDYPREAFYAMMNLVDSHDTNRVLIPLELEDTDSDPTATDFSDGKTRLQALVIIQMTMPGAPTIYYGDEVGLVGYGDSAGGGVYYSDPYNRQPYPWADEAGYGSLPVWRQQDLGLRAHYSATAGIRNAHPALRTGSFDTLLTDDDQMVYAYGRKLGEDAAVVVLNLGEVQTVTVNLSGYLPEGIHLTDELNGGAPYTVTNGQVTLPGLPQWWGAILTVNSGQDLTPPDAPTNLVASEGNAEVGLTWTAPVTTTAGYNVYRSYVSGGGYTRVASNTIGVAYTDTSVTNGTQYFYVVTALDPSGNESTYSNQATALPHIPIDWAGNLEPALILHTIGLTPTQPISAQVWIDGLTSGLGQGEGVSAELGFGITGTVTSTWEWESMIYVGDVGNNDQYAATLTPEMTGTMQYLARFSTTQGREWAHAYASGQVGVLTVQPSADTAVPATPQNLQVVDWAADRVMLSWEPVTGDPTLYAYDLYRSEVSGTMGALLDRIPTPLTAYTDTEVNTGQTYTYVVQALDTSFNRSGYSNQVHATAEAKKVAVTFQAVVPDYTPADATVYVVGDLAELCGWCNPQTIALQRTGEITWTRVITLFDGQPIQYKYTRGSWDVNEWWGPILSVNNRHATVDYGSAGSQLLTDQIHYWRDPLVISHSPADDATGVVPTTGVSVTLSRYLEPATISAENLVLASRFSTPTLSLDYFYQTEMTATSILITPTAPLSQGARYTMTLRTGLRGTAADNEGIALQREYSWSFRVAEPMLSISKEVTPTNDVLLGRLVTYTIVVSNSGDADAAGVLITDHLPAGVTGTDLSWTGTIVAGGFVDFSIPAMITDNVAFFGQLITNTAFFDHTSTGGSDDAILAVVMPQVRLVSPVDGQFFTATNGISLTVPVTVATKFFDIPGEGHWHLYVDGESRGPVYSYATSAPLLVGTHVISAELCTNDQSLGIVDAVTVFVLPPNLPDLSGSTKISDPAGRQILPGALVTYTVTLSNSGLVEAMVLLTDVLGVGYEAYDPMDLTELLTGTLTWSGMLAAGQLLDLHFVLRVVDLADLPIGRTLLGNEIWLDDGANDPFPIADPLPPWVDIYGLYLPLIIRR